MNKENKKIFDEVQSIKQEQTNANTSDITRISSCYLEFVKATNFGKFSNAIFGPFSPGLNVVYGPNESGKTTINELIKGVLFRWPQARRNFNSYKLEGMERQGSLFFKDATTNKTAELTRTKNNEALTDEFKVLADIDEETYATMFALTSDELMALDRHNEITARLLTAGSGTNASPAQALDVIEQRIKNKMSRAAGQEHSIAQLRLKEEAVCEKIQQGVEQAEHYRAQEQTFKALEMRNQALTKAQTVLNAEIEALKTCKATVENVDKELAKNNEQLQETHHSEQMLVTQDQESFIAESASAQGVDVDDWKRLSALSQAQERELRDYLDEASRQQMRYQHLTESARAAALKSQAEHELLTETRVGTDERTHAKRQRMVKLALSVVIPLILLACGIYLIFSGQSSLRFSYLMIALGMLIGGVTIGSVGVVMNIKPTKIEEQIDEELHKSEWVMKQDEKNYEKAQAEEVRFSQLVKDYLDSHFLKSANGSIRQARHLLEAMREFRAQVKEQDQNKEALQLQKAALVRAIQNLRDSRSKALAKLGLPPDTEFSDLDMRIEQKEQERDSTIKSSNETHQQYGEILQELQQARFKQDLDKNKLELELLETQLEREYNDLASLFIARRSLEAAIAQWERKSQPEVYRKASKLMAQMTDNTWQEVRMDGDGNIVVRDALMTSMPPYLLSLGTRQQLYLSLRIALLAMADNVGRALPVLCDDILVNFDESRRVGAAKALAELARHRQVLVFTCHSEVVSLLQSADSSLNFLEL